jgi:uncharacterized membrane protein
VTQTLYLILAVWLLLVLMPLMTIWIAVSVYDALKERRK